MTDFAFAVRGPLPAVSIALIGVPRQPFSFEIAPNRTMHFRLACIVILCLDSGCHSGSSPVETAGVDSAVEESSAVVVEPVAAEEPPDGQAAADANEQPVEPPAVCIPLQNWEQKLFENYKTLAEAWAEGTKTGEPTAPATYLASDTCRLFAVNLQRIRMLEMMASLVTDPERQEVARQMLVGQYRVLLDGTNENRVAAEIRRQYGSDPDIRELAGALDNALTGLREQLLQPRLAELEAAAPTK